MVALQIGKIMSKENKHRALVHPFHSLCVRQHNFSCSVVQHFGGKSRQRQQIFLHQFHGEQKTFLLPSLEVIDFYHHCTYTDRHLLPLLTYTLTSLTPSFVWRVTYICAFIVLFLFVLFTGFVLPVFGILTCLRSCYVLIAN